MELKTILVVDDSNADQFLSQCIIEEYDPSIEVLQALDGKQALDMLDSLETPPDLILLDINMPRMNGFEFLDVYDQQDGEKSSVVVMITSSNQERDKKRAEKYKCVSMYLNKPLTLQYIEEIARSAA